jgi:integrase
MPAAARKVNLTDRSMLALKPAPAGKRLMVWDGMQPNLGVRVTDQGRRSFVVVRRLPGAAQPTWTVLGQYPTISLADARRAAREALGALAEGKHPSEVREQRHRAAADRAASTFAAAAEDFIRYHARKRDKHGNLLRTSAGTAADIRRFLVPAWGERPIAAISHRDVFATIEAIVDRGDERQPGRRRRQGGPNAARHALAAARLVFGWAYARDLIAVNPCARIDPKDVHGPAPIRNRVLTNDELRIVWRTAEATPYPYGPLVQMLALTGQRLGEIAEATWSEIDLDLALITIPAERMKAKIAHTVPLTPTAVVILEGLPRFTDGDLAFSTSGGRKPFSGFSKAKARFDKAAGIAENWTLHDIRRSVRTALSSLGVLPHISELTIGHKQQGIAAVYDRHRYDQEKRDALSKWEARLLAIVGSPEPAPDNVVPMPMRARA